MQTAAVSHWEERERRAEKIVEEARSQAEAIQRDAYHAGFEQGERAGEKLALQKIEPVMHTFEKLIEAINGEHETLTQRYESELIKIAFLIATEILKKTIEMDADVVRTVVSGALSKVSKSKTIKLIVSPPDEALIKQFMENQAGATWIPPHVGIESDAEIGRGGCKILTESGEIDATIETQLSMMRGVLWDGQSGSYPVSGETPQLS